MQELLTEFENRFTATYGYSGMTTFVPVVTYHVLFGNGIWSGDALAEMVRHTRYINEMNNLLIQNNCSGSSVTENTENNDFFQNQFESGFLARMEVNENECD